MGDSSMAIQVASLPHVHEQGRSGAIHGIDSDRHTHGPVGTQNGMLNGGTNMSPPASLDSLSEGSPDSHRTQGSDATHFGKDERDDTYEDAHNELLGSNDTQQTDQTVFIDPERSDGASVDSNTYDLHTDPSTVKRHLYGEPNHTDRGSAAEPPQLSSAAASEATARQSAATPTAPRAQLHDASAAGRETHHVLPAQPDEQPIKHAATGTDPAKQSSQDPLQHSHEPPAAQPGTQADKPVDERNTADDTLKSEAPKEEAETKRKARGATNQPSASRAAVAAAELNDDVLVGTRVTEGHENFVTAYNMLTGIRVAVSRCTAKVNRPLTNADFSATDEISFDLSGAGYNPSSKYMFRFKDYAPWVFRHLRDAFRLDPADYLMSLTAKYIVSELGSPGKSGSFFYYSRDYRFIIKTIRHSEHKLLRRILSQYYSHVKKYPDTLISQFYGLHRVRLPFGRKIHFVVMNNVFPALYEIHERYDLKGSLLGREYNPNLTKPIVVYKDLDWLRRHKRVVLGPQKRERLVKQLEIDARFLERVNVMDYSLLVGIHDKSKGNSALNTLLRLKEFGPHGEQASKKEQIQASEAVHGSRTSWLPSNNAQHEFSELQMLLQKANPEQLKEFDFADEYRSEFYFYRDHGGFQSTNDQNEEQEVIYYVGIIDFLTGYTFRKSVETFCKSLVHDRRELSAVPAQEYGERFLKFLRGSIGPEIKSTKPAKRRTDQSATSAAANTDGTMDSATQNGQQQNQNSKAAIPQDSVPQHRTMVKSPIVSSYGSAGTNKPANRVSEGANGPPPEVHTPQKAIKNGAATPLHNSSPSHGEGPPTPGVAVTSNTSPSVTSRKPTPPSSNARRPSVAVYGQNVTGKEG